MSVADQQPPLRVDALTAAGTAQRRPGRPGSHVGPLLLISGEQDHTVPWAIVNASYKQQQDNPGVTEIEKIPGRGHALIIDSGWRDVAEKALAFVQRFVKS